MNLFDLTAEAQKILELEDIDQQTINDTFEGIGLDDKYAAYAAVIKTLRAEEEAIADAIAKLQDKKKARANKAASARPSSLTRLNRLAYCGNRSIAKPREAPLFFDKPKYFFHLAGVTVFFSIL